MHEPVTSAEGQYCFIDTRNILLEEVYWKDGSVEIAENYNLQGEIIQWDLFFTLPL